MCIKHRKKTINVQHRKLKNRHLLSKTSIENSITCDMHECLQIIYPHKNMYVSNIIDNLQIG